MALQHSLQSGEPAQMGTCTGQEWVERMGGKRQKYCRAAFPPGIGYSETKPSLQHELCTLSTKTLALPGSSLSCDQAWYVTCGVTNTACVKMEKELCGTSITRSLAGLSKMTPECPRRLCSQQAIHMHPGRGELFTVLESRMGSNPGQDAQSRRLPRDLELTFALFFCNSNLPGNNQKRDPKHKTVSSSRSGSTKNGTQRQMGLMFGQWSEYSVRRATRT